MRSKASGRSNDGRTSASTSMALPLRTSRSNSVPPTPSSHFISYLAKHPRTPTRELLRPYLTYEARLRELFAKHDPQVDDLANLVPVYDGQENMFKIRTIDRQLADDDKYIMPLKDDQREADGSLAITPSLADYRDNFDGFTHAINPEIDWSNIVVAGSSALLPLLSYRRDVHIEYDHAIENPLETYYQTTAGSSDIDIFLYGLDSEDEAVRRILEIENIIRKNQRLFTGQALSMRTNNAITFISPRYPFRHVQIILRLYKSISEILTGFDVDCACVAFDGTQVYTNPRGITAITTRTNTIDLTRRSPSYENRLFKYRNHNFEVYWDSLDRSRVKKIYVDPDESPRELTGLARLILSEQRLRKYIDSYRLKRALKRYDDGGEPVLTAPSGYASHEIPYGEKFTAQRVRQYVIEHAKEPYRFGTIHEVTGQQASSSKKGRGRLSQKVTFIKDNPGRQMIGSFNPITDDDWFEDFDGTEEVLRDYFSRDPEQRFELERAIGSGMNGIAWRIKYKEQVQGQTRTRRLILKVDRPIEGRGQQGDIPANNAYGGEDNDEDEANENIDYNAEVDGRIPYTYDDNAPQLVNERIYLKMMQKAMHVVNLIEPPHDPFAKTFPDVDPHGLKGWVFMEYLENGTLRQFTDNVYDLLDGPLPNRLLWRLFLCLIRACIAMSYPPHEGPIGGATERIRPDRRPRRIEHGDMHDENVMFGPMIPDGGIEHALTPILKLIDFGSVEEFPDEDEFVERGESRNVFHMGVLMCLLISQDSDETTLVTDGGIAEYNGELDMGEGQPSITVAAGFLCPDNPDNEDYSHIDSFLLDLVLQCTACRWQDRPRLVDLEILAYQGVTERTPQAYAEAGLNAEAESDENIRRIIQDMIFNART
ncbi:hypothetical protein F5Y00DRAFT_270644 [Daldinia vernicosa]|uniref:uncharacterized protein n=1 Tax=Daldinia vernicosa TaxID=114800 RepID=UPI0020079502|nr:uncharacterized protein F5Y00DRAFT_270644 [Daldinia vernicosa]KAI0853477.1 hypothetical protein F5Y00DRAFT_270644 [Daldinia vernicosa]